MIVKMQKCVSSYIIFWQSNFHNSKYTLVLNEMSVTYEAIINPVINPKINVNSNPNPNSNPTNLSLFLQQLDF